MPETTGSPPPTAAGDAYTVGYGDATLKLFQRRTLATCAWFVCRDPTVVGLIADNLCRPFDLREADEQCAVGRAEGLLAP